MLYVSQWQLEDGSIKDVSSLINRDLTNAIHYIEVYSDKYKCVACKLIDVLAIDSKKIAKNIDKYKKEINTLSPRVALYRYLPAYRLMVNEAISRKLMG
jgi:hypothetical protein